ncbi:MAG TPA: hypothetical protein VKZ56_09800 [Membranihabitans sp.]|nr:hypothetical protein [Membranihabitans sp.]
MNLIDQIFRLKRIHHLITTKSTGPPCAFSRKLGISNRQLFRLLDELKTYGLPIEYCRHRQSYFYAHEVKVDISFEIIENGRSRIFGGKSGHVDNSKNQWETDYLW